MDKVHKGLDAKTFDKPSKSSATALCTQSRKLATGQCKVYYEYFSKGSAPTVYCNPSVDHHKNSDENSELPVDENGQEGGTVNPPVTDGNTSPSSTSENSNQTSQGHNTPSQPSIPPANNNQPTVNLD